MNDDHKALCEAFLLLENTDEVNNFLKDLCTPNELNSFIERWRVCKLLYQDKYSYREIHTITGASLTTIGRVARFLKDEQNNGYLTLLKRIEN